MITFLKGNRNWKKMTRIKKAFLSSLVKCSGTNFFSERKWEIWPSIKFKRSTRNILMKIFRPRFDWSVEINAVPGKNCLGSCSHFIVTGKKIIQQIKMLWRGLKLTDNIIANNFQFHYWLNTFRCINSENKTF